MKWRYIIPTLLFYAVAIAAYFAMTLRHTILFWILLSSVLFLSSLTANAYLLLRAKKINDPEVVRRLRFGIQTELLLDLPFIIILVVIYLCELNDLLILIIWGLLGFAWFFLREYLKRRYLKVNGQILLDR